MSDNLAISNDQAAASMIKGATVPMGDGSLFDYLAPESCAMTLEDYAFGLAAQNRFNGQTRVRSLGWKRRFFTVAHHCSFGAIEAWRAGKGPRFALRFLTHESGETVCGDAAAPMKTALPEFRPFEKRMAKGIDGYFGWEDFEPVEIKQWDLRMLATEYRDLIKPALGLRLSQPPTGYEPFARSIVPFANPVDSADYWLYTYKFIIGEIK
jgi:uncharacterized protein